MNEREMRAILGSLCADLDAHAAEQRARWEGRTVIAGAVLGLTLGLASCVAVYAAPEYGVVMEDAGVVDAGHGKVDGSFVDASGAPVGAYGAPPDAGN